MEGRRTEGKVVAAGTPQLQTDYTEASTFTGNGGSWPLFQSTTRSRCAVGLFLGSDDAGGRGSSDPSFAPYSDSEWYEPQTADVFVGCDKPRLSECEVTG
jgi:hypothetical protein